MKNNIQLFNNPQFGQIRVAQSENGEPIFCLADVCKALDLTPKGVNQRLAKGVISNYPLETAGGTQIALFVNEDGLYDVILDSRKSEAKQFRKWVTSEVLPAIRKHGGYLTPQKIEEVLNDPDTIIQLATNLKAEKQRRFELEKINEQNKPKVLFAEAVETAKTSILIGELADYCRNQRKEVCHVNA